MESGKQKIVNQSKRWLCEALIEVMKEKSYENITVKEISEKAMLARRTFYRHFKEKGDLLKEYTIILFNDYIEVVIRNEPKEFKDVIKIYFLFWNKNIEFLKCLKRNELFFVFVEQHSKLINTIIKNISKFKAPWHNFNDYEEMKYATIYSIGGLWNVLSEWIDEEDRKSADEVAQILVRAIENFKI